MSDKPMSDKMPRATTLRSTAQYYDLLEVWCLEDGQIKQAKQYAAEAERLRGLLTLGVVPKEYT